MEYGLKTLTAGVSVPLEVLQQGTTSSEDGFQGSQTPVVVLLGRQKLPENIQNKYFCMIYFLGKNYLVFYLLNFNYFSATTCLTITGSSSSTWPKRSMWKVQQIKTGYTIV